MARLNSSSENEGLSLQSQSQAQANHRSISSSSKLKTYGRRRAKLVEIKGGNTVAVTREIPREEKEKPMRLEAGFKTMGDAEDDEEEDDDQVQEHERDTSVGDIFYEAKASEDTTFDYIILKPRASVPPDAGGGGKEANGEIEAGEGSDPAVGVSSAAAEAQEKPDQNDKKRGDEPANSQDEEVTADAKEEAERVETSSAMPVLRPTKKRGRPSREDKSASSQAEENLADTTEAEKADASSAEPVAKAPKKRGRPSGSSSSNKVPKTTKANLPSFLPCIYPPHIQTNTCNADDATKHRRRRK